VGQPNKAIYYYKQFNTLSDSIFNKQTAQSLAAYRTLYEVERTEQQIELLNKDNELSKALVQRQQIILYSVVAGAIVLLVLVTALSDLMAQIPMVALAAVIAGCGNESSGPSVPTGDGASPAAITQSGKPTVIAPTISPSVVAPISPPLPPPGAHLRRDLWLWRQCADCDVILCPAAHVSSAAT